MTKGMMLITLNCQEIIYVTFLAISSFFIIKKLSQGSLLLFKCFCMWMLSQDF